MDGAAATSERTVAETVRTALAALALVAGVALTMAMVVGSSVSTAGAVAALTLFIAALAIYAWDSPTRSARRPRPVDDPRSPREQRPQHGREALFAWAPAAFLAVEVHSVVVTLVLVVGLVAWDPVWMRVARRRKRVT